MIDLVEDLVHRGQRPRGPQRHLQFREFGAQIFGVWKKLVKRRIEQTDRHWQSGHLAKDSDEIAALKRQKFLKCFLACTNAFGKDHLAHGRKPLVSEEHVFRSTESDAFRAKLSRRLRIERR